MKAGQHKLTDEKVKEIFSDPRELKIIADAYRISVSHISAIKAGERYPELTTGLELSEIEIEVAKIIGKNRSLGWKARGIVRLVKEHCKSRIE